MKVGFIGLGTMGAAFAKNLQSAGYALVVNDVRREAANDHVGRGAAWADSPKAVAEASEIVFTSLPGPPEVEAVAVGPQGLLAGAKPGLVVFDLSTNSPAMVRYLSRQFTAAGAQFLDAPVSGGPVGAATRKLVIWVGGDRAAFDRYRSVLDAMGDRIRHVGDIGAATVAKLVHNAAGYGINTVLAEVFSLGVKAGVDPANLWEAIRQGGLGRMRAFDGLQNQFLAHNFDPPAFALKLAHKDVGLAAALGREHGVPMRLINLTLEEMTEALNRGWAGRDSRIAMTLQTERAGVTIAVAPETLRDIVTRDGDSK